MCNFGQQRFFSGEVSYSLYCPNMDTLKNFKVSKMPPKLETLVILANPRYVNVQFPYKPVTGNETLSSE